MIEKTPAEADVVVEAQQEPLEEIDERLDDGDVGEKAHG